MSNYARRELERRFLLDALPAGLGEGTRIEDRYLSNLRIRLRRMAGPEGEVYKLTQKIPEGPSADLVTTFYLEPAEYAYLKTLPGWDLAKIRYRIVYEGKTWAVDVFDSGLILAEIEIERGEHLSVPDFLRREVTDDPRYSGGSLARFGFSSR